MCLLSIAANQHVGPGQSSIEQAGKLRRPLGDEDTLRYSTVITPSDKHTKQTIVLLIPSQLCHKYLSSKPTSDIIM